MSADTGGTAFPTSGENYERDYSESGMTLRDYFAAKALHAAVGANWRDLAYDPQDGLSLIGNSARLAYMLADAMLLERAK